MSERYLGTFPDGDSGREINTQTKHLLFITARQIADEMTLVGQQRDRRCSLSRIKHTDHLADDLDFVAIEFLAHVARRGMRYQNDLIAGNEFGVHTR